MGARVSGHSIQNRHIYITPVYISDVSIFYSKMSVSDGDFCLADLGAIMHMTLRREEIAGEKILLAICKGTVMVSNQVNRGLVVRELQTVLLSNIEKNDKKSSFHVYEPYCKFSD